MNDLFFVFFFPFLWLGKLWRIHQRKIDREILFPALKSVALRNGAMDSDFLEYALICHFAQDPAWAMDFSFAELKVLASKYAQELRQN
jgi:hypothetical protein